MEVLNRILYVEDDQTLRFLTSDSLKMKGFDVKICEDGEEAWAEFQKNQFDICVLDVMLPKMDGFELAQKIRETDADIPIIFLTAKSLLEDKISGLKLGGDDYIIKPFSIEELVLKIQIFLKRNKKIQSDVAETIQLGDYSIQFNQLLIQSKYEEQHLTLKEAEIIRFFIENLNTLKKREDILKNVWGEDDYFIGRSLDVFISRIRKYFSNDKRIKLDNVHGVGFILRFEN